MSTAFDAYILSLGEAANLPWEVRPEQLAPAFMAGYQACLADHGQSSAPYYHSLQSLGSSVVQGPTGSGTAGPPVITAADIYADIYAAYPRKVGKQAALKAIGKAAKVKTTLELFSATQSYALAVKSWPAADKQFIPHPATWFNRGSYDDDPKEWQRGLLGATTSQFSHPPAR